MPWGRYSCASKGWHDLFAHLLQLPRRGKSYSSALSPTQIRSLVSGVDSFLPVRCSFQHTNAPRAPPSSRVAVSPHANTCPILSSRCLCTADNRVRNSPDEALLFIDHTSYLRIITTALSQENLAIPIQRLRYNASSRTLLQAGG